MDDTGRISVFDLIKYYATGFGQHGKDVWKTNRKYAFLHYYKEINLFLCRKFNPGELLFENKDFAMNQQKDKKYVQRIAKLAKENKELKLKLNDLQKKLNKLLFENEKQKALLESLSPEQKRKGKEVEYKIRTLRFDMATVLFADIQGFSKLSRKTDSQAIIDRLDEIFFEFDAIAKKYKIEKIKYSNELYGAVPEARWAIFLDCVMVEDISHFTRI